MLHGLCAGEGSPGEKPVSWVGHTTWVRFREGDVWTVPGGTEAGCSVSLGASWHPCWCESFGAVTEARSPWQNYTGRVLGQSRWN